MHLRILISNLCLVRMKVSWVNETVLFKCRAFYSQTRSFNCPWDESGNFCFFRSVLSVATFWGCFERWQKCFSFYQGKIRYDQILDIHFLHFSTQWVSPGNLAKFQFITNITTRVFGTFISENLAQPLIFLVPIGVNDVIFWKIRTHELKL